MIKIIPVFTCLFLIFAINVYSAKLSEQEYTHLLNTSSKFKESDKKLNETWKLLNEFLTPEQKKRLLIEQRKWLKEGRDLEAKKYIEQGLSKEEAYIEAIMQRKSELQLIIIKMNQSDVVNDIEDIEKDIDKQINARLDIKYGDNYKKDKNINEKIVESQNIDYDIKNKENKTDISHISNYIYHYLKNSFNKIVESDKFLDIIFWSTLILCLLIYYASYKRKIIIFLDEADVGITIYMLIIPTIIYFILTKFEISYKINYIVCTSCFSLFFITSCYVSYLSNNKSILKMLFSVYAKTYTVLVGTIIIIFIIISYIVMILTVLQGEKSKKENKFLNYVSKIVLAKEGMSYLRGSHGASYNQAKQFLEFFNIKK